MRARTDARLDPCVPEPVTDVAESEVFVGTGAPAAAGSIPAWRRLYDDGLGLLHAQQENVDDARPGLERALSLVGDDPRQRAIVLHAMAEMAVREGRTDEALQHLDDAAALLPDEPAIPHARAQALGGVWRWKEAAAPLAPGLPALRPSTTRCGRTWRSRTGAPTSLRSRSTRRATASP